MTGTIGTSRTTARTGCRPSGAAFGGAPAGRGAVRRRLVALVAAALVSSALFAPAASAHHFTGEVQLWASRIDFRDTPNGVLVSVLLIERESGESVSGFGVRVTASDGRGTVVGPVELQESEFAVYSATLSLGPGEWEILAATHQGNSSLPAIESAHRKTVEIDAAGRFVPPEGGGSGTTTILAIVLPVCAVAVLLLVVLRRRRLGLAEAPDAPDDPDPGDPDLPASGGDVAQVGR